MPVSTIIQYANPAAAAVALAVEQSGMVVTVKAGSFRVNGTDYKLDEDQTFTAQERDSAARVDAKIVEHDGEVFVLVDEAVEDAGVATPFDWKNSPYKVLWTLFWLTVPASTTSLDGVTIHVLRVEAPPAPEADEEPEPAPEDEG